MGNVIRNIIFQLTEFLKRNLVINVILVIAYSYFIVFMHPDVVEISITVMNSLSLESYNFWVKIISAIAFSILSYVVLSQIFQYKENRYLKLFYIVITILFIAIHSITMFEMNIEIIHGLMYGILTFLLFPLTGRYAASIIFALPVMLYDEWYQYVFLYPDYVQYYELNDIVMDLLGSGLTVVILFGFNILPFKNKLSVLKRLEWYILPIFFAITLFILSTCYVVIYPEYVCDNTVFILNKLNKPELFWQVHPFTKAEYHVLSFKEAIFLITALCYGYAMLDIATKY
mgnify:CR=1 FL=1